MVDDYSNVITQSRMTELMYDVNDSYESDPDCIYPVTQELIYPDEYLKKFSKEYMETKQDIKEKSIKEKGYADPFEYLFTESIKTRYPSFQIKVYDMKKDHTGNNFITVHGYTNESDCYKINNRIIEDNNGELTREYTYKLEAKILYSIKDIDYKKLKSDPDYTYNDNKREVVDKIIETLEDKVFEEDSIKVNSLYLSRTADLNEVLVGMNFTGVIRKEIIHGWNNIEVIAIQIPIEMISHLDDVLFSSTISIKEKHQDLSNEIGTNYGWQESRFQQGDKDKLIDWDRRDKK